MEAIYSLVLAILAETYGAPAFILAVYLLSKAIKNYSPPRSVPSTDSSSR